MLATSADGLYGIRHAKRGYEFVRTRDGATVAATDSEETIRAILRLAEWRSAENAEGEARADE